MLKKIVLENFQAHENLELDLGRFTTITGGSNSGKSAILRAVAGLLRNDSAANYIQHGKDTLKVTFVFDDFTVEWIKGKKTNSYKVISDAGTREFTKVGSSVPEEVSDLLCMSPIELRGGEKLNLSVHSQLESPFLISDGPTFVAKVFGELTSASQIYSAIGDGSKQVRSLNAAKTSKKTDLSQHQETLNEYNDIPDTINLMEEVSSNILDAQKLQYKIDKITKIKTELNALSNSISQARISLEQLPTNVQLSEIDSLYETSVSLEKLTKVKTSLATLNDEIPKKLKILNFLDSCLMVDLEDVEALQNKILAVRLVKDKYINIAELILRLKEDLSDKRDEELRLEKEINSAMRLLTSCPTCAQMLGEPEKQLILGELNAV